MSRFGVFKASELWALKIHPNVNRSFETLGTFEAYLEKTI